MQTRRPTILLADDEMIVLDSTARLLESSGFMVLQARDGREAVALCAAHAAELDVALLDLAMPELSGEQAFEAIHGAHPDLPVLVASGYDESEVARIFRGRGVAGFVQKPFEIEALVRQLRAVMAVAREVAPDTP